MNKSLKKLFLLAAVVITSVVCLAFSAGALDATGQCGENVYWTFDESTGELVISGTGSMYSYNNYSPFKNSDIKSVLIENGVTSIANRAFVDCTSLTSITIPDSVTSIGFDAFGGCTGLISVIVPDSVTLVDGCAFYECEALKNVFLGNSVTKIGYSAFEGCTSLKSIIIPDSVTSIGSGAFEGCTSLVSISLPFADSGMGWIFGENHDDEHAEYPDYNVPESLKEVIITQACKEIESRAFADFTGLTSITISDGVTSIGSNAFFDCTSLASITIPDSVTFISSDAFYDTEYYKNSSNWVNGVLYIGNHLIAANDSISDDYTIKSGTLTVADLAFGECIGIETITIPSSVNGIGTRAFSRKVYDYDGEGFVYVTNLPDVIYCYRESYASGYAKENSFNYVLLDGTDEESIFSGKVGKINWTLDKRTGVLELKGSGNIIDFFNFTPPWYEYRYCVTEIKLSENITGIGAKSFNDFYRLKSVTLHDGITFIGDSAFAGTAIESVVIPNSVTTIGNSAFSGCGNLKKITLGKSVISIGDSAFSGTGIENVVIPDTVTTIGKSAFSGCGNLKKVTLGKNVTSIGDSGFSGTEIESIVIPESVESIGERAFQNCSKLEVVNMSGANIGTYAFSRCQSLESVYGAGNIVDSSFSYCENLKNVTISNDATSIGRLAFYKCDKLNNITIPDSVTYIGTHAFRECNSLEKIIIPNSVASIGKYLFYGCVNLKNVVVSSKVKNIPANFVTDCVALESVTIYNPSCTFNENCGLNYNHTIYGFKGSTAEAFAEKIGAEFIDLETIHTHEYKNVITKATITANGKIVTKCSVCDKIESKTTIYYPKTITLSKNAFTYNGKAQKPSVTVKDSKGKTLKNGSDYTVSYSKGRTLPGKYNVTVTFKGKYSGTNTLTYSIIFKAPTGIKTTQTSSTIKLTWKKAAGADGYRVYMYNTSTKKWVNQKTLTATSLTVKNLRFNTTYQFKIVAYKKVGNTAILGNYSSVVKVTTKLAVPSKIKIAQNESAIKLTWNKVAGADGYRVYMYNTSTKKWVNQKTLTATSLMIKNLKAGTTYQFKIIAYKKVNGTAVWGDYTAAFKASTRTTAPKITGVASTAKKRVAVAWSDVAGETGYELWASTKKDSGYKKVVTAKANVTKGVRTDFVSGRTYYFKVRAYKTVGNTVVYSAWSSAAALKVK